MITLGFQIIFHNVENCQYEFGIRLRCSFFCTMENHFERLKAMYLSAPVNHTLPKPAIKIGDGVCEIDSRFDENYFHAAGSLHGAMYFKMLDDAAYFAAASLDRDYFLYTVRFETRLKRPVTTEILHAEGLVTLRPDIDENGNFDGGIKAISRLYADGKLVAEGSGEFRRGPKKLVEIATY